MNTVKSEPVAFYGLVQAVIGLVSAFGLHLSADQIAALLAVTSCVLALVARTRVTPLP